MSKFKHNNNLVVAGEKHILTPISSPVSSTPSEIQKDTTQINYALTGRSLRCINNPSFPYRDVTYLEGEECVYYADIFEWKRNTPDIRLHRERLHGPVAGLSHFRWNRCRPKVGIGSDGVNNMTWVEMECKGVWNKTQRFEWKGKKYVLRRVSSEDCKVIGVKPKFGAHLKVVEEGSGGLVALHICESLWAKKKAALRFADGVGDDLEVLIVLAIATWREIIRRS